MHRANAILGQLTGNSRQIEASPVSSDAELAKIAAKALAIVHQQTLTPAEASQLTTETVEHWKNHVNEGFLKYRKSVGDAGGVKLDWTDPHPGTALFQDQHGTEYIDCLGGFGIFNVGRRHPEVVNAVLAQMNKQALHSQELLDPLRAYLCHLLSSMMPSDSKRKLTHVFLTNSGTESVEACLKMAVLHTGRKHIVAAVNGFHGKTIGSLSATSKAAFRAPFLGVMPNTTHVPWHNLTHLTELFKASRFTGNEIAAVILEPIQGEGGIHVASDEYLRGVRKLCDEYGACLIFDEIQCGMGRTGQWWYCNRSGVVPDLMAVGKSFGGGVMPAGACVGTAQIWEKYFENPFILTTTFGGNPLACAAAIATINVIIKYDLLRAARERGKQFKDGLLALKKQYPQYLSDVRGEGLMIGIEFHENDMGVDFSAGVFAKRVLVSGTLINAKSIRIEPPLTITQEQVDKVLAAFGSVIAAMQASGKKY